MKNRKIIWSVNPSRNSEEAIETVKELNFWANNLNCQVQPVTVIPKIENGFPYRIKQFFFQSDSEEETELKLSEYLNKLPTKDFLKSKIIYSSSGSNIKMASDLSNYSKETNAVIIVAGSRMKKTSNPFRLGGFAESLISFSQTPILLMQPKTIFKKNKKVILLPCSLKIDSELMISETAPYVSNLDSKIILFNQIEMPTISLRDNKNNNLSTKAREVKLNRISELQKISNNLRQKGIQSSHIIIQSRSDVGSQIIDVAKKNHADLIIVTNSVGLIQQTLLGSIARDVITSSKCPVLVIPQNNQNTNLHTNNINKISNKIIFDSKPIEVTMSSLR